MPQRAWSKKRERQYEHIKEGVLDRGEDEDTAEEIAARTVNKERARHGEARQASRTSTQDISSSRRGGLRSHRGPALQRGPAEGRQGPLQDDQGPARTGRGPVDRPSRRRDRRGRVGPWLIP